APWPGPLAAIVGKGDLHGRGLHQSRSHPAQPAARGRPMRRSSMTQSSFDPDAGRRMPRPALMKTMGGAAGGGAPRLAFAQAPAGPVSPPSTITTPPRDFGPGGAPTTYFTDPDVLTVEPEFNGLRQPNTSILRLWTGAMWSEGPAWSSQGRYLVW